jgi:hypothetical protein
MMKTPLIGAALFSALMIAPPSVAQVQFGIGPDGRPNVQIGPSQEEIDRERRREFREQRRREWRERGGPREVIVREQGTSCRTVTIEDEDESGDIVVRRRRICD